MGTMWGLIGLFGKVSCRARCDSLAVLRIGPILRAMLEKPEAPTRAVVIGIQQPDTTEEAFHASLDELERLADTLGIEIVGRVTQRRAGLTPAVLGEGKLKELAEWTGGKGFVPAYVPPGRRRPSEDEASASDADERRATVVLVDHDLGPSQLRNLERATSAEVLDRSMVILSIFQRHAKTREARLQVEIAHLAYMAPRLREANAGVERQRGGIGGKGAGETALELDRRRIRDRISELKRELESIDKEANTRRSRRSEACTVALVGYTNAGKSSLMRTLTGDEVYVADQLFATLDTTVRVLVPLTTPRVLVSDTVGFIKKLPHDLVASFRSTLDEAKDARLLLHVVDAADPAFRDQLAVTVKVLSEIGATDHPRLLVLNKSDKLTDEEKVTLTAEFPDAVLMSAREPERVAELHARIVRFFHDSFEEDTFVIPYSEQRFVAELHAKTTVLEEKFEDDGAHVRVRGPLAIIARFRRDIRGEVPPAEEEF